LGAEYHLRALGGLTFEMLFLAVLITQAVMAFMLLRARHSREFR
jgi:hypothetical protein